MLESTVFVSPESKTLSKGGEDLWISSYEQLSQSPSSLTKRKSIPNDL